MKVFENGQFVGLPNTQNQRVCDHCGYRFLSGAVWLSRTDSVEAVCHRCLPRRAFHKAIKRRDSTGRFDAA